MFARVITTKAVVLVEYHCRDHYRHPVSGSLGQWVNGRILTEAPLSPSPPPPPPSSSPAMDR